jgi:translocation and assembly module TamB
MGLVNAMAERWTEDAQAQAPEAGERTVVVRRAPLWARVASWVAIGTVILFVIAIAFVWIDRRPIATHYLKREFERRGVQATYHLDRVGLRTQEVSDLVIGDPNHPDLVARHALIQMRIRWDGGFDVYRIVARGVRLRGRLIHGKVSWGQIDKLLPPPTNKPFELPNFVLDVADSSIALSTPFGPLGFALDGSGRLSGGFKGRLAIASPQLVPGRCAAENLRANVAVAVVARRPNVQGPVSLNRLTCPLSRFEIEAPTFDTQTSFNEAFTSVDGRGRMAIPDVDAGNNGLDDFIGTLTYKGSLVHVDGNVDLAAQQSRLGTITANRTRLTGRYHLGIDDGTFALVGNYAAQSGALAPSMFVGVTQPLAAAAKTPVGPIVGTIANAIIRTARNFDASGAIRVVNFPGGGAARIDSAEVRGPGGARARVYGGTGVTYYWPTGGLRIDGNIDMGGGGLPSARVSLRQGYPGGPMNGVADVAPYAAGGSRLALTPIRFAGAANGATSISTLAQLDGNFPGGRVQALRLPIDGLVGRGGSFAFGRSCEVVSFNSLQMDKFQFGAARLPVCPIGPAIFSKRPGGPVMASARFNGPVLNGRLGSSPLHLAAAGGQIIGKDFTTNSLAVRLGNPASPITFDAARLTGSFAGSDLRGKFTGAKSTIGTIPLLMSDASGNWLLHKSALTVNGGLTLTDRSPDPRFYPLRSNDVHFTLAGDYVRATGSLHLPANGALVTNVNIQHQLSSGVGHALLDVPGLTFGPSFQPEQLTRLTEGVVALVNGTVSGQGRINWAGHDVTSTGDFSSARLDLAAPFGPVTGMRGTIHFNDLLAMTTPPGQVITVESINPGILVQNGVIRYQLLPHQLVKVERGQWPFMGGQLILHETVLNFGHPSAKRLTFEVVGFDAKQFVDSLGFQGIELTGTFDGVLPMIFDENGGRIVGGRLDARSPGGELQYTGTKPKAGMAAGLAFDLLRDIRYRSMIIRLNGDLAGEFATKVTIDQVSLGPGHGFVAGIVHRAFAKLPIRLNLNINGPFRALIQMAKAFKDPTQVIAPVMPFPIDSPSLKVVVQQTNKQEQQTTTSPTDKIQVSPKSPSPREK